VPVDLGWDGHGIGASLRRIEWIDCGGVTFTEPFFLETVARLRSSFEARKLITTTPEAITRRFETSFDYRPAELIFHVSRCGSTALANCLKLCERAQVISEYRPLTTFHWHGLLSQVSQERRLKRVLDFLTMKVGAWSLANCSRGLEEDLVLKLTSSSLPSLDTIKAILPQVPCVLIVMTTLEVLVASLRGGGWMDLKGDVSRSVCLMCASHREGRGRTGISNEEYGARVLGNYLDVALKGLSEFDLIIDHSELTGATVQAVVKLFNLRAVTSEAFEHELTLDAKRRDGSRYIRSAMSAQAIGSPAARTAAERHAIARYEALIKSKDTSSFT
jgi:hypothetical protein